MKDSRKKENDAKKWKNPGEETEEKTASGEIRGIRIRTVNAGIVLVACALLFLFLLASYQTSAAYQSLRTATDKYISAELAANNLKHASDHLTTEVRMFAVTTDPLYLERYFEEVDSRRREQAVHILEESLGGTDAHRFLDNALRNSMELMEREYASMRLIVDARGYELEGEAREVLRSVPPEAEAQSLPPEEKLQFALNLVHDQTYQRYDEQIDSDVSACIRSLNAERQTAQRHNTTILSRLLRFERLLAVLLLFTALAAVATVVSMVLLPLSANVERIRGHQPLPMAGAYELRYLAKAYNTMYEENQRSSAHLRHEAEHDPLTGLYNRGAFDKIREEYHDQPIALMLIDVDLFKDVNDTYGHDTGDKVLQKVAGLLSHSFRFTDYPCRIGGDEFAVIMTDASSRLKNTVRDKLLRIAEGLRDTSDGLPAVTMSIGVAFCDRVDGTDDIFKDADRALYAVKTHGRDGCEFYGERYLKF